MKLYKFPKPQNFKFSKITTHMVVKEFYLLQICYGCLILRIICKICELNRYVANNDLLKTTMHNFKNIYDGLTRPHDGLEAT